MPSDEEPEIAELQVQQEAILEAKVNALREDPGFRDPAAMDVVFELFSVWIGLYRLNKTDALLKEVMPICEELGGSYHIKAIQMLGFCRWKQYRYREALALFHRMEGMVGPSAALCENIGHTYSSLGDLDKAEKYFEQALSLSSVESRDSGKEGNVGGILLGLGLIKDRKDDVKGSLPVLQRALDWYKEAHSNQDHSLVAKAHSSVGKAHEKLGNPQAAEEHFVEALRIFEITCGDDSPLTAGAAAAAGKVQLKLKKIPQAQRNLKRALALEATKDSVHLQTVFELMTTILEMHSQTQTPGTLDREAYKQYLPHIADAERNLLSQGHKEDGDFGAFCKSAGEFCCLGLDYPNGARYLEKAIALLSVVTTVRVDHLIETCKQLHTFAMTQMLNPPTTSSSKPKRK